MIFLENSFSQNIIKSILQFFQRTMSLLKRKLWESLPPGWQRLLAAPLFDGSEDFSVCLEETYKAIQQEKFFPSVSVWWRCFQVVPDPTTVSAVVVSDGPHFATESSYRGLAFGYEPEKIENQVINCFTPRDSFAFLNIRALNTNLEMFGRKPACVEVGEPVVSVDEYESYSAPDLSLVSLARQGVLLLPAVPLSLSGCNKFEDEQRFRWRKVTKIICCALDQMIQETQKRDLLFSFFSGSKYDESASSNAIFPVDRMKLELEVTQSSKGKKFADIRKKELKEQKEEEEIRNPVRKGLFGEFTVSEKNIELQLQKVRKERERAESNRVKQAIKMAQKRRQFAASGGSSSSTSSTTPSSSHNLLSFFSSGQSKEPGLFSKQFFEEHKEEVWKNFKPSREVSSRFVTFCSLFSPTSFFWLSIYNEYLKTQGFENLQVKWFC